jgi:NAD(P)-dependent dehydrogenase (short-subunit alcohol dehydrogenase family)
MAIGNLIPADQHGRTIVITGASAGIGAAAARRLAAAGATVIPVGRSRERTAAIAAELGTQPIVADFSSLDEVRAAGELILARHPRIDVLVNNAGGVVPRRTMSSDGHEMTFQGNHLAGFLLTQLLLPALTAAADSSGARVINTSSFANRFSRVDLNDVEWTRRRYGNGWLAYCASKLMNIMTVVELQRRLRDRGIAAVAFHPEPGRDFVRSSDGGSDEGGHQLRRRYDDDARVPARPRPSRCTAHGLPRSSASGVACVHSRGHP